MDPQQHEQQQSQPMTLFHRQENPSSFLLLERLAMLLCNERNGMAFHKWCIYRNKTNGNSQQHTTVNDQIYVSS